VLVRRQANHSLDYFDRDMDMFVNGFGSSEGEYWMGLHPLHV
jgi:hypothetical protein